MLSQNRKMTMCALSGLEGGQVESAEVCGAPGCFCGLGGLLTVMKLEDAIEHNSREMSSRAVFMGTSVPIELLFEFLEDDQTMDTFLDQFPMVSRDQARAVLGASKDMLLCAARSWPW
jgi:uncharacterized protein (DUF433 family)